MATNTAKPGFLLIEMMVAILFLVVSASIAGFYIACSKKEHQRAERLLKAICVALQAIDTLKEGIKNPPDRDYIVSLGQKTFLLEWSDGKTQVAWANHVLVAAGIKEQISVYTILPMKAL